MSSASKRGPLIVGGENPSRKRRRPATSCEPCRARKVRCDQGSPCGPCKRARKSVQCLYQPDESERSIDESRGAGLADALIEHAPPERGHLDSRRPSDPFTTALPDGKNDGTESSVQKIRRLEAMIKKYENERPGPFHVANNRCGHEQATGTDRGPSGAAATTANQDSPAQALFFRNNPEKTKMFGRSHWIYIAEAMPTGIGGFRSHDAEFEFRDVNSRVSEVLGLYKQLSTIRNAVKAPITPKVRDLAQELADDLPLESTCTQLISCYAQTFQPIYRIIHMPSFWADYSNWRDTASYEVASLHFVMKLALMMAIGTTFYQGDDAWEMRQKAPLWISLAQEWITGSTEKSTLNLEGLQVFCLLLLAKQTTWNSPGTTWISAGSLLNVATSMGLHRDPSVFSSLSPMQIEMRKRLWAATMELTIQTHMDAAIPLLLSLDDFDTPPPLNIDDADTNEDTKQMPASKKGLTESSLQIQLLESFPLRLRVVRLLNGLRAKATYEEVLRLGNELRMACRKMATFCSAHVVKTDDESNPIFTRFHEKFMDIFLHRYIVLLHQSFMIKARDDPRFHLARKVCVESATVIASHVCELDQRIGDTQHDDLFRLASVSRVSFRGPYTLHIILVICLEIYLQLEDYDPSSHTGDRLDEMHKASRQSLTLLLERIQEHHLEFIKLGNVSLKSYNFLAVFLGQIRAMEAGENVRKAAFETIKSSLKTCLGILTSNHGDADFADGTGLDGGTHADAGSLGVDYSDAFMDWDISNLLYMPNLDGM